MAAQNYSRIATLLFCAAISLAVWSWGANGEFGACVKGSMSDQLQKTIAVLDGTIDLGIKLSTSLVGAGAALLVGITASVKLTRWVRVLILVAVLFFGQSAGAAVFWKLRVANSWLNECLNLVSEQILQRLFLTSYAFFFLGLATSLLMVCFAAYAWEGAGNVGPERTD